MQAAVPDSSNYSMLEHPVAPLTALSSSASVNILDLESSEYAGKNDRCRSTTRRESAPRGGCAVSRGSVVYVYAIYAK